MKPRWYHSLAVEVTLLILLGTSIIFGTVLTYSYFSSKHIMEDKIEKELENLALSNARRMEIRLRTVQGITATMGSFLENTRFDPGTLNKLLKTIVEENEEIYGSAVAFEPYAFQAGEKSYATYFYRGSDGIEHNDLNSDSYDYLIQDWYSLPRELKKPVWSTPYFDEGGGNIIMTTYSLPFFEAGQGGEKEKVMGIVTADVSVKWLTEELSTLPVGKTGYCFLISETGVFLAHPDKNLIMHESIFSLAEQRGSQVLRNAGKKMLANRMGFTDIGESLSNKDSFLGFGRLGSTGWSLGVVYPKNELFEDITRLHAKIAGIAGAALAMLLLLSVILAGSITSPLRKMVGATAKVASGELDLELPAVNRRDEVGRLARAFANMTVDLKKYIRELTETVAAKERIEGELGVAAEIQRSMLPSVFPAFPDRDDFDIYAVMHPAKEVGGDFYQFLLVDENHLCVAIGDVSGKGVPASLLMAVTTSLIRIEASGGMPPDEMLGRLNKHLVQGNDTCMFVTVFCGILNLTTGEFKYANGGHETPFIVKPDNEIVSFPLPGGPVVGIMPEMEFPLETTFLMPGDSIFMYTDGVTEAFNANEELYSKKRLSERLQAACNSPVKGIVEEIDNSVAEFAKGVPQADDITILGVKFSGKQAFHATKLHA